jgi:hypothetical protein
MPLFPPYGPSTLNPFVIQCSCDWERKITSPDCRACAVPACVTCDRAACYESYLGGVCLDCFTAPQPSLATLALLEAAKPVPLSAVPQALLDRLL